QLKTYVRLQRGHQLSQVIIISSVRGYLVPVATLTVGLIYYLIKSRIESNGFSLALLFYLSAAVLAALYFFLGSLFDSKKQKNDFFFIPMRYYSAIIAAVLILDFFWPFVQR
ncbi:MAG: hypothetical protein KDK33_18345, partial [Leptospiraceae bacterium]|nr:hypothetical protein [Leptospiraceae bacterium]